jgi:hypothetical protein
MTDPDKWAVITDADGHRVARGLWAFTPTGRLNYTVADVWLKPDIVRVDLFNRWSPSAGYTLDQSDTDEYRWFVVTWSAAAMKELMRDHRKDPKSIAHLAMATAKLAAAGPNKPWVIDRGIFVRGDVPWMVGDLLDYIRDW